MKLVLPEITRAIPASLGHNVADLAHLDQLLRRELHAYIAI